MATVAAAQVPRTQVQCNGQLITEVAIQSRAPTYGGLFARSPFLGRVATAMQTVTTPAVVENFVLLRRGELCSILLRQESERLLRAQPFIADAFVTAYADGSGGVRLEVVTVDEPSLRGSVGFSSHAPFVQALAFGNTNLRGRAVHATAGWRNGGSNRDGFFLNYVNYQLFGRPYQMHLTAARREHGYELASQVAYPFFSDLQPRGWRLTGGASDELVDFRRPGAPRVSLGLRRQYLDAGGIARIGRPGQLGLVGVSLSAERSAPDRSGVIDTDDGLLPDPSGALEGRYDAARATRLNLMVGYRQVNYLRVAGFDALSATQDVRRGVQVSAALGRGLPVSGSPRNELYAAGNLYAGVGSPTSFAALELQAEGRRPGGDRRWDSLLLSGRLASYIRPHPRHTLIAAIEAGAGRRQRLPFQLALGDWAGGVRGYDDAELGGGQRVVMRLEERWRIGTFRGTADGGVALFVDAGRLWAGDVPLGRSTGWKPAVGVGLLAAVPPRSHRTWRVDFAYPLSRQAGAGFAIRITNADRTRAFWMEPQDLRRNHERSVPVSVFTWP